MQVRYRWWRLFTVTMMVLTAVGLTRLVAMAGIGVGFDCPPLRACVSVNPFQTCTPIQPSVTRDLCCIGYSSSQTRVCCQYSECQEYTGCEGAGCRAGISQPVGSSNEAVEFPNKNCVNGRCQ